MPLFRRANALISQASGTLSDTSAAIARVEKLVHAVLEDIREAVEEAQDGVRFELVKDGDGTIMDFVTGKIDTLPVSIRMKLREGVDKK